MIVSSLWSGLYTILTSTLMDCMYNGRHVQDIRSTQVRSVEQIKAMTSVGGVGSKRIPAELINKYIYLARLGFQQVVVFLKPDG